MLPLRPSPFLRLLVHGCSQYYGLRSVSEVRPHFKPKRTLAEPFANTPTPWPCTMLEHRDTILRADDAFQAPCLLKASVRYCPT